MPKEIRLQEHQAEQIHQARLKELRDKHQKELQQSIDTYDTQKEALEKSFEVRLSSEAIQQQQKLAKMQADNQHQAQELSQAGDQRLAKLQQTYNHRLEEQQQLGEKRLVEARESLQKQLKALREKERTSNS